MDLLSLGTKLYVEIFIFGGLILISDSLHAAKRLIILLVLSISDDSAAEKTL